MHSVVEDHRAQLARAFTGIFTNDQAHDTLGLPMHQVSTILRQLVACHELLKVGQGLYLVTGRYQRIQVPAVPPPELRSLLEDVERAGIEHFVTGLDCLFPFIHLLPMQDIVHLVYVRKGGGEWAFDLLLKQGIFATLNPDQKEWLSPMFLTLTPERAFVAVRETSLWYGVNGAMATPERAFVDLYLETRKRGYPVPAVELGRILANFFDHGVCNLSRLIKAAHERSIDTEIKYILRKLPITSQLPSKYLAGPEQVTQFADEVVAGIHAR